MPYDGSNGIFTTAYNFVTDASNGIKILASRVQGQCTDIATGLTTALTKDGQTTPTANLPMGGFIHTNVGNASARNNYAVTSQVQDGSYIWTGTLSGTDTYTGTLSPAILTYTAGVKYRSLVTNANTGAATVNLNSLGAKSFRKNGATALSAGDILAGSIIEYAYDGTNFQLLNVGNLASLSGGTFTGAVTLPNTGLKVLDTNASHTLGIVPGSDLTANRTLTLNTGDSNRAVTFSGDFTVAATASVSGNNFGAPYGYCRGFIPPASSDITGNATTATINISAGQATDSTNSKCLTGAAFTSGTANNWAVSNGNAANGYQGGTTLPNSSTIHFYVIALATDTTWTATFASTSLTPTLPGSYTLYKRIFSLKTSGAGAPLAMSMTETDGGSVRCAYTALITDYSGTSVTSTASLLTVATPAGLKTAWMGYHGSPTTNSTLLFTSPEDPDDAVVAGPNIPSTSANTGGYPYVGIATSVLLITNTSSQLRARCDPTTGTASTTVKTAGWIDYRR